MLGGGVNQCQTVRGGAWVRIGGGSWGKAGSSVRGSGGSRLVAGGGGVVRGPGWVEGLRVPGLGWEGGVGAWMGWGGPRARMGGGVLGQGWQQRWGLGGGPGCLRGVVVVVRGPGWDQSWGGGGGRRALWLG